MVKELIVGATGEDLDELPLRFGEGRDGELEVVAQANGYLPHFEVSLGENGERRRHPLPGELLRTS